MPNNTTMVRTVKIRDKGQITIPSEIQEEMNIKDSTVFSLFGVGDSIMLVPKLLSRISLVKDIQKEMKKERLTLQNLLSDLKKQRKKYNKEIYG